MLRATHLNGMEGLVPLLDAHLDRDYADDSLWFSRINKNIFELNA